MEQNTHSMADTNAASQSKNSRVVDQFEQIEDFGHEVNLNLTMPNSELNLSVHETIYEVGAVENGAVALYDSTNEYEYVGDLVRERVPGLDNDDRIVFDIVGSEESTVYDMALIETRRSDILDTHLSSIITHATGAESKDGWGDRRAEMEESFAAYHADEYDGEQTLAVDAERLGVEPVATAIIGATHDAYDLLIACDNAVRKRDEPVSPLAVRELLLNYYLDRVES